MDKNEFLEEVLHSNIAPDNFEKIYKEFNTYQDLAFDTLIEFDRVCKKRNVLYQLACGSLLGAVRDGGQIPWDYDVDVYVPYEEKEKLITALSEELNSNFYFYCPEVNENCRHEFIRVTPKGYKSEILHVDVFFVIGISGNTRERNKTLDRIEYLFEKRYSKLVNIKDEAHGHPRRYLNLMLNKIFALMDSTEKMHQEFLSICSNHPVQGSIFCTTADSYGKNKIYPVKEMWSVKDIFIEGHNLLISSHAEDILEITYVNYKDIPPLSSRIKEVMNHHKLLLNAKI